jgi:glycerophosphoryl diester phosphodiesterase
MKTKLETLLFLVMITANLGCVRNSKNSINLIDFRNRQSIEHQKPILIAHRGGVITEKTPECSLAAIRLAKQQGYAMVELDVQQSRDGIPIVFHDNDLKKTCGIDNRIANMDSKRIVKIKFSQTDQTIITLDRALEECLTLSLGVMLDVKVNDDEPFFQTVADLIKKYKYEPSTITINADPALRKCFKGVVMLTVTPDEFNRAQKGETVDLSGKYWFGLPHRIPDDTVKHLHQNGAYVIPAINTFRYPEDNHYELARKDINRLIQAGVEGFQIDSVYKPLFDNN